MSLIQPIKYLKNQEMGWLIFFECNLYPILGTVARSLLPHLFHPVPFSTFPSTITPSSPQALPRMAPASTSRG